MLRIIFSTARKMGTVVTVAFALVVAFGQTASAQNATNQLQFGENYFVTGDYVVAGVGLRGLGGKSGYATQTLTMPDANSVPSTGVPAGADIVAAILYWQTVESSQNAFVGQNGFFRPKFNGGPATGYSITGVVLGNPNAPTSWSSGGCSGGAQGSKTIRTYRADVRPFLEQDANGNILAGNTAAPVIYEVSLPDSGKGGGAPITLGATLVIVYRAITPSLPLNSVVIYDGAAAPGNSSSDFSQTMQGFYQAAANPISKLTHIVGNGQNNKFETVSLTNQANQTTALPSLYGAQPPFPGFYNGSWDNPTWSFPNANYLNNTNPIAPNDSTVATMVVPSASNSGCVSWGAVIVSTTVQDSKNDGLLDVWKTGQGYCDASVNNGVCVKTDPSWVDLTGADTNKQDIFVQMDYMCSIVKQDGSCDTVNGYSFLPDPNAQAKMITAFSNQGINLHLKPTYAIQEPTCTDALSPTLCFFPNQPGVVDWKNGLEFIKEQPLNKNLDGTLWTEAQCEANPTTCIRRFQHGRKDSYHYALFAHASATPSWGLVAGNLTSVLASGTTVTFTTSTPHGLVANDTVDGNGRVTVIGAISNFSLNGTYYVKSVPTTTTFTIQIANATNANYTFSTDPGLWVFSGQAGTGSGISDVGGADSLISLGSWGADGQGVNVQAGTFMHELGHSLGLTHGGFYYDTAGSYVPTIEPNCKTNYQSVMSYLFQVDLLDDGVLDYSEQGLKSLNENSLPAELATTDGSALAYSTTKWYTTSAPFGVGTAATHHCDGSSISPNDPDMTMYRVEGTAAPITPASTWVSGTDVNFDGALSANLRGHNDWTSVDPQQPSVDLRQVGATANDIGSPGVNHFGTGVNHFGTGVPEIDRQTANSFTRPPRKLTATVTGPPNAIQLNWTAPTFGQIASYNIYRGAGTNPAPPPYATVSGSQTSFLDTSISCGGTYNYFVTALLSNGQESVASNLVTVVKCGK